MTRLLIIQLVMVVLTIASGRQALAQECTNWSDAHPEWLFCDDFETGSTQDYDGGWRDYMSYVTRADQPADVLRGERSIQATITPGVNSAASMYKYFPGQDGAVYARWYAKFDADYDDQGHQHFVTLQGLDTSKTCGCSGCCANTRPNGDDRFLSGLEFKDQGATMESYLYSYFYNQRNQSTSYHCCPKPLSTWAQVYAASSPAISIDKGTWHEMELMVRPNTPGEDDGVQTYWIDGVLALEVEHANEACGPYTAEPYSDVCETDDPTVDVYPDYYSDPPPYSSVYPAEGFVWRTTQALKLNNVWLQVFNHEATTNPGVNKVWFDNLVVSRQYIGPLACVDGVEISASCVCGGEPDPNDASNVHSDGYCCGGTWQSAACGEDGPQKDAAPTLDARADHSGGEGAFDASVGGDEGRSAKETQGCGCTVTGGTGVPVWILLALALLLRRRAA